MFRLTLNSDYTAFQERITVVSRGLPVCIDVYILQHHSSSPQANLTALLKSLKQKKNVQFRSVQNFDAGACIKVDPDMKVHTV